MANEKRLIDADFILDEFLNRYTEREKEGNLVISACEIKQDFADMISNAPTVDAVTVVRCSECKHRRDKNEQEQKYLVEDVLICTSPDVTDDCWSAVWPDHFCSYGERKVSDRNG